MTTNFLDGDLTQIGISDPKLGDTDATGYPVILGRQTENVLIRYNDTNWPGRRTLVLSFDLPKCHAFFATFAELDAFLLTNNGLPIQVTLYANAANEEVITNAVVYFSGANQESLYYWHFQLTVVEIL